MNIRLKLYFGCFVSQLNALYKHRRTNLAMGRHFHHKPLSRIETNEKKNPQESATNYKM